MATVISRPAGVRYYLKIRPSLVMFKEPVGVRYGTRPAKLLLIFSILADHGFESKGKWYLKQYVSKTK